MLAPGLQGGARTADRMGWSQPEAVTRAGQGALVVDGVERQDDASEGQRLVALPRRVGGDPDSLIDLMAASPAASVDDLLDRTNHLLAQLEIDIASLREDQARDR